MKLREPCEWKRRMLKQAGRGQKNTNESITFRISRSPQIHSFAM